MSILEKNTEMMKNILNKELGTDISHSQQNKAAVFDISEYLLPNGETVNLNILITTTNLNISTFLGSVDKDNIMEVDEFIAVFNMQRNIVKCGICKGKVCVKTDMFVHSNNQHEEERLTRALKAHLAELSGIVKKIEELTNNDIEQKEKPENQKRPKKNTKTKFDFSLFDNS